MAALGSCEALPLPAPRRRRGRCPRCRFRAAGRALPVGRGRAGRTDQRRRGSDAMTVTARWPPVVSGGTDTTGHLDELRTDPIGLMQRVRDECGDIGSFVLG